MTTQHDTQTAQATPARLLQRFISHMEPAVFIPSALLVIAFVVLGAGFTDAMAGTFESLQSGIIRYLGWSYILTATALLALTLWLMTSRFGRVKLGGDDAEPEFSRSAWFAMLFSAGMGTGLVFWGVAEPLSHARSQPALHGGLQAGPIPPLRYAFFHWGLHPWAIYAVFGLGIAYQHFRRGLPLAPRSLLHPWLGQRVHGVVGHVVDTVATVGTLFGVATSLGLGAMQLNTGIEQLFGVPFSSTAQVAIVAVVTLVATLSVVSGLHGGVRRLSQLNMGLAVLLLLFVATAGPTLYLVEVFVSTLGSYLQSLPSMSLWINPDPEAQWQADWTLFYWAWWISWSPFVGVFTARISRGRTVREYLVTMLLVPSLATFVWFAVFGGTALHVHAADANFAPPILDEPALALHALLQRLPMSTWTAALGTLVVLVFFVTSSDSGSFVDDMVTSGGDPNPPRAQRVFWAVSEGAVAATLLLTGGLQALRTASLTTGLPMMLVLVAAGGGLVTSLRRNESRGRGPSGGGLPE